MVRSLATMISILLITCMLALILWLNPSKKHGEYKEGDRIPVFANIILPFDELCVARPYFNLPFCPPGDPIPDGEKSLKGVLNGDCFINTRFDLRFKVNKFDQVLCEIGRKHSDNEGNISGYFLDDETEFHLFYKGNRIVGATLLKNFNSHVNITQDVETHVKFKYSVFWEEWSWETEQSLAGKKIMLENNWAKDKPREYISYLFTNAIIVVSYFVMVWLLIENTMPYLSKHITKHVFGDEEKAYRLSLYHHMNDSQTSSFLHAVVRVGSQLFIMILVLYFLAFAGVMDRCFCLYYDYPLLLLVYFLAFAIYWGMTSISRREHISIKWWQCVFQTGFLYLFPVLLVVVVEILNETIQGFLQTVKLVHLGVTVILLAIMATGTDEECEQENQETSRYKTAAHMLLGGLIHFVMRFKEMDSIYASLYISKVCNGFRTMVKELSILVAVVVVVSVAFTKYQLRKHDYKWAWRSILRGGSPAIFMYVFGIIYASGTTVQWPRLMIQFFCINTYNGRQLALDQKGVAAGARGMKLNLRLSVLWLTTVGVASLNPSVGCFFTEAESGKTCPHHLEGFDIY
ncbi:Nonaspanin (TM9SF) [Dillenia turbinata]|uniref:Transmembrane 9 superfamily member n=1 Tax=Dillenia turbinata TaxID=194707 RepID=A0AAN8VYG1_9MAGN